MLSIKALLDIKNTRQHEATAPSQRSLQVRSPGSVRRARSVGRCSGHGIQVERQPGASMAPRPRRGIAEGCKLDKTSTLGKQRGGKVGFVERAAGRPRGMVATTESGCR